jgi:hypothetical protein
MSSEEFSGRKCTERERERKGTISVRSCGFVEREGLFAFEGDRQTAKMEDFDEEKIKF